MWRQRAALRTSSAPPRPRNDRSSGDVVMEDALANDESASQSYGVIRRPNFVRNGGRSEEQVRNTEESLLQSAAGLRSYENVAVDLVYSRVSCKPYALNAHGLRCPFRKDNRLHSCHRPGRSLEHHPASQK